MTAQYKIIDNFLSNDDFLKIKNMIMSSNFNWYYQPSIVSYENSDQLDESYFFTHKLYSNYCPTSNLIELLNPLVSKLNPKAIIRINANLYPNVNKFLTSKFHQDYEYSHKGAVFYVNSNNGYTTLSDGTKIESIENRILLHDASDWHSITQCTDEKTRVVLVFNYF